MPLPPLKIVQSGVVREWSSSEAGTKPPGCAQCRFSYVGKGFCADEFPDGAKVGLLLSFPDNDSILERRPLAAGNSGLGAFVYRRFVYPLGRTKEELGVGYVLRCRPPWAKGQPAYPTGSKRTHAEGTCRQFDSREYKKGNLVSGGIQGFAPDLFLVTYDPYDVLQIPAYVRQFGRDLQKAFKFADEGHRVLVLCGLEAMELVLPFLAGKGGVKSWRGHFVSGEWPFGKDYKYEESTGGFAAAELPFRR